MAADIEDAAFNGVRLQPDTHVAGDRRLGRYYTPDDVAEVLVEWALWRGRGPLLDPSYGGCSFLLAGLKRMLSSGVSEAPEQIYGIDVDPAANGHAHSLVESGVPAKNLITADFFDVDPRSFAVRFECVVGNPPFIRHHWLDEATKSRLAERAEAVGCPLPGTANTWAHFVALSAGFLVPAGRMAMLVPQSGLEADYAVPILRFLEQRFRKSQVVPVEGSLFAGTKERVAILLADGWNNGPGKVLHHEPVSRQEIRATVLYSGSSGQRVRRSEKDEAWRVLEDVQECVGWRALEAVAGVAIGTVSGANEFFIRTPSELRDGQLPSQLVVTTSRSLSGIAWTQHDASSLEQRDAVCRLLTLDDDVSEEGPDSELRAVIEEGIAAGVHMRSHCRRRDPWWSVQDLDSPDAFFHYMTSRAPRIVLNGAGSLCTNAIHRVSWRVPDVRPRIVAASSCTSLFELACELRGRSYSGGVLKLEPSAVKLLPVASSGRAPFLRLDQHLRSGEYEAARKVADEALLVRQGVTTDQLLLVRDAVQTLRSYRRRHRRERGHDVRVR